MANKRKAYKFDDRSRYGQGVLATVSSVISLIIFLTLTLVCTARGGSAGSWVGTVGFAGFVFAFYGMLVGLNSFRKRILSYTLSKVGTLLGGLMVAVWFIIFCVGLAGMLQ